MPRITAIWLAAALLWLVALLAGFVVPSVSAATYYWDNNGSTNGFGTASGAWAVPTTGSSLQGWSTSSGGTVVPGNVTTTSADDLNFGSTTTGLAAGTITVSGTVTNNTLTFASGSGAITLTGGTIKMGGASAGIIVLNRNDTINSPILLLANATINAPDFGSGSAVSTLTLGGAISGSASVTFSSASTVANNSQQTILLNAQSSYTGSTTLNPAANDANLIVKLGIDDALPKTTVLSMNGVAGGGSGRDAQLELNGHNQTLGGLQNTAASLRNQQIYNSSATIATLTVSNSGNHTYSRTIDDNIALVKSGSGTQTLSGGNNYTNDTTITGGTLAIGGAARLGGGSYAADISISAGAALLFNSSANTTLRGAISGSGSFTNSGSGTVTLTGTTTLPSTTVNDGTFAVTGSGRVTGLVVVNSGGDMKLAGGGRVNKTTVNAGGSVSLSGAGVATNLVFVSAGTMNFDVAAGGVLAVTAADGITNKGAAGSITINLTGGVLTNGTYTLITYSGSLRGSGFGAYQFGTGPVGKNYTLVNAAGAVQVTVTAGTPSVRVETKASGTGVVVPAITVLVGTSLTNFAIVRDAFGIFLTNTPATWVLTNLTGAVANSNLVAAPDGKSAVFNPTSAGSARILAVASGTNSVGSGTITSIGLSTRPFIWVRDSEKAGILAKIATNAWSTSVYNTLVARTATALTSHQNDRDAFLRGLPVSWSAVPPTFFSAGASSAAENFFNTALDCAVLYYLTDNSNYARCAADILHNSVQAFQNLTPSADVGNGGWLILDDLLYEARQSGTQLAIVYDFLYQYLQTNQVYEVGTAGLTSFSFPDAQFVFRTYYQLVRDHGQKDSNWSALMSTCMLNNLLALDSSTERAAALQIYLTTGSSRQASLDYDYQNYTQPGDIWPESLQYSGAVGEIRSTHLVLLERYSPTLNLFGVYSNLPTSLPRISYLRYPNSSMQISFGDGYRDAGGQPFFRYELVYQHARARGRTNLTAFFGSLINGGVATGGYSRSTLSAYDNLGQHDDLLQLLWQAPTLSEPSVTPELPRTDTLPFAGIALQRNPSTVNNSTYGLMGFVGGAAHVHSHASGMSMELFGLGQVMGAKSGRDDYGSTIHEHYYRLFAANNTVIVNAASQGSGGWEGLGINTVQTVAMEPQPFATAVSSNVSFTCSSFADNMGTNSEATQQRTLSIIRTSPTSGFYVDFFRSKSTVSNRVATTLNGNVTNQFHDYIYHNVGSPNVSLTTNGVTLPLVSQPNRFQNDIGDGYDQPGWRYFTNTVVSYPHNQPMRAQFNATPSGTTLYMDMIMPAVTSREYAQVSSPPIVDYSPADSPAIVVRQMGDAWDKPFAVVYEPHLGATGGTVTNVTTLLRGNIVVGLKIESSVAGQSLVHYVFSNPGATETYTNTSIGLTFKGRFGLVTDHGDSTTTLYLGDGSALSYRGNSVAAAGGTNTQAEVRFVPGQPPLITANAPVNVTWNLPPTIGSITNQTVDQNTATPALPFTVDDDVTSPAALVVTATSSNTNLVPNANIALHGSNANRTITLTPALTLTGTTTIQLVVNDGALKATNTFTLTVVPMNAPPSSCVLTSPTNGQFVALPPTLTATATDPNNDLLMVSFYADGSKVGEDTTAPYSFTWSNAVTGVHSLFAVAIDAGGRQLTSAVANVTLAFAMSNTLVSAGAVWRYFDQTNDLGTSWRSNAFSDVTWSNGPARLGFGNDGEVTKVASNRQWTTYFRRTLYVPDPALVQTLGGRLTRDDGAVLYLNGAEIWRDPNMPAGLITNQTPALTSIVGETNWIALNLPPATLTLFTPGWNLLAAEVHQSALTSSDLGFDLELTGTVILAQPPELQATVAGSSLVLTAPADAVYFTLGSATNFTPPVNWIPATNTAVVSNNQWRVTVPAPTNGAHFFRLQSP